jgi:hypothetical protein
MAAEAGANDAVVSPRAGTSALRAVHSFLGLDGMSVATVALAIGAVAALLPVMLAPDSWMSFVDGRLIVQHGLPHIDTLTHWTLGRHWIDQQWGAHVLLYEVVAHLGLSAVLGLGLACVVATLVILGVAARKLGGTPTRTAPVLLLPVLASGWLVQLRAQSLALPLFAAVYAVLVLDARSSGRRVLWVLPLLVVWANVHGSVALGAALVALRGLQLLRRRGSRVRAGMLVVGAPLTLLASPYGTQLISYYRLMLFHPPLASVVAEWEPASVSRTTSVFFISAFVVCALWGGHRRALTSFEGWALAILLVAGLGAIRNALWFELAVVVALPRLLNAAWPSDVAPSAGIGRLNRLLSVATVTAVALLVANQLMNVSSLTSDKTPAAAAATIARAAGKNGLVVADQAHADWLLWKEPSLVGRVAYDVRFELFTGPELSQIGLLNLGSHPVWLSCGAQARVVTFGGPADEQAAVREDVLAPGSRTIVRRSGLIAVQQPAPRPLSRCPL